MPHASRPDLLRERAATPDEGGVADPEPLIARTADHRREVEDREATRIEKRQHVPKQRPAAGVHVEDAHVADDRLHAIEQIGRPLKHGKLVAFDVERSRGWPRAGRPASRRRPGSLARARQDDFPFHDGGPRRLTTITTVFCPRAWCCFVSVVAS
jgi:hypothetical protein